MPTVPTQDRGAGQAAARGGRFDLTLFGLREMTELGSALRKFGDGAHSMEEAARRVVRHLYENAIDSDSGESTCVLVRFFKTHSYGDLEEELRAFADSMLGGQPASESTRCLTLLASAGEKPEWNHRRSSRGHQAIPLSSEGMVESAPMISNLLGQLGVEVGSLLRLRPDILVDWHQSSFNVFYIPQAIGSPYIPAQEDFAIPMGLESVLGFGGRLPSGDIFAVILFSKAHIPRQTADLFGTLALNVKMAVLDFEGAVFG